MKILVGIMHGIENELDECLAAVDRQSLPAYDRFVLSGLSNKEAHDTLYQTFMDHRQEVDLFMKIDADMVLSRHTFFEECAERFVEDGKLQHIQIALDDWMTNRRIFGLHVYRSSHAWELNDEAVFVDMVDVPHERVDDRDQLAPAAVHCPNPSPFQAYHFGLHKGVKFVQKSRPEVHARYRVTHWNHFEALEQNYHRTGERRLGLALLGFHDAILHNWGANEVNFSAPEPKRRFEEWNQLTDQEIKRAILSHFPLGWKSLPHTWRFEISRLRVSGDYSLAGICRTARRIFRGSYRKECPLI